MQIVKIDKSDSKNIRNILDGKYSDVEITKDNIKKYLSFVLYLDFDIKEQFVEYIFLNYTVPLYLVKEEVC